MVYGTGVAYGCPAATMRRAFCRVHPGTHWSARGGRAQAYTVTGVRAARPRCPYGARAVSRSLTRQRRRNNSSARRMMRVRVTPFPARSARHSGRGDEGEGCSQCAWCASCRCVIREVRARAPVVSPMP